MIYLFCKYDLHVMACPIITYACRGGGGHGRLSLNSEVGGQKVIAVASQNYNMVIDHQSQEARRAWRGLHVSPLPF